MRYIAIINHYRYRDSRDITIVIVMIAQKNGINNPSILFYSSFLTKEWPVKALPKVHIHLSPTQLVNKCPVHAK